MPFEKTWNWNGYIYYAKYPYRKIKLGKKCIWSGCNGGNDGNDTAGLQEKLLELQADRVLEERFVRMSLTQFWAEFTRKPILSNEAEKVLLPFPTLCETGFS